MLFLKLLLTPPTFTDEEKTHQAYLLHVILLALIAIPIPFVAYLLIQRPEEANRALTLIAASEIIHIILFIILRRGYVRQVSVIQVITIWLFFATASVTSSSVYGVAYMLGNGLVITIAGILLGGRGAMAMTLLAMLEGGTLVYAEQHGWVPPDILDDAVSTWIVIIVLFSIGASLQNLAAREVRAALNRANASEERYRLISKVSSDYTFSTELDLKGNMRLNWVAGAFESITGYTYEEYVAGGGWLTHLHPDDREKDAQDMATLRENQPVITEVRTYKKDRELSWVRVYGHPIWDEKQNRLVGIVGAVQDITGKKQAEEYEQRRRAMLEKVIQLGKRVTEVNDLRTTLERIWHGVHNDLEFDRLAIFLYNPKRNSMDDTFGTDNYGQMIDVWDVWFPVSEATTFMQVLEKPDGLYFTHDYANTNKIPEGHDMYGVKDFAAAAVWAGDKPVAVICVDHFITGRPIADEQLEALRLFAGYAGLAIENARLNDALQNELEEQKHAEESEQRRRVMLEKVIQLGKSVTEVNDLRTTLERIWYGVHDELRFDRLAIFLYNPEKNSMDGSLGTNNEGQIVEEWNASFPITTDDMFYRVMQKPDGYHFTHNYHIEEGVSPEDEMYGVKDFAAVAASAGEKPVAIIVADNLPSGQSITSEKLEALRLFAGYAGLAIENARLNTALQNELIQRQAFISELEAKNAELERFTYTVSHDLKSPLVTITGFLGYLEKDAIAGDIGRVRSSINRITVAAQKMQELLNDLLELSRIGRVINSPESLSFSEIILESLERVQGQLDAKKIVVKVQADLPIVYGDRVRLVEVVQNLIDNAAKFSDMDQDPRIEIGTKETDQEGQATLFVRDHGIGIQPEFQARIFGLFNKLDHNAEGTGIGLTLVKRIIEVHGGKIWVESEPGKGATFYFTLPTSQQNEE
jgi:PAS domain S-box-containing protein